MRRLSLVAAMAAALPGCKTPERSASRQVITAGGEEITFAARSIDDTSVKWATRAVGWETKRGAVLSMTVGDRPTLVLQDLSDAEQVPSQAEVDALVAGVKARASANGQHLLVSWKLDRDRTVLYHLLPRGVPFELELPGEKIAVGPDMDLDKLPSCQALALEALALAAREPEDCSIPGPQEAFWEALQEGAPGTRLEKPLLALWPACSRTWIPVANITRNSREISAGWKADLKAKRDAIVAAGGPVRDLRVVLDLCLFIEDAACVAAAAAKLAPAWPGDDGVQQIVMDSFDKLPKTFTAAVIERAMGDLRGFSFEEQARIYRVMKKWADCDTFAAYATAHPNVVQERDDCKVRQK